MPSQSSVHWPSEGRYAATTLRTSISLCAFVLERACHRLSGRGGGRSLLSVQHPDCRQRKARLQARRFFIDRLSHLHLSRAPVVRRLADHAPRDVVNAAICFASAKLYRTRSPRVKRGWPRGEGDGGGEEALEQAVVKRVVVGEL